MAKLHEEFTVAFQNGEHYVIVTIKDMPHRIDMQAKKIKITNGWLSVPEHEQVLFLGSGWGETIRPHFILGPEVDFDGLRKTWKGANFRAGLVEKSPMLVEKRVAMFDQPQLYIFTVDGLMFKTNTRIPFKAEFAEATINGEEYIGIVLTPIKHFAVTKMASVWAPVVKTGDRDALIVYQAMRYGRTEKLQQPAHHHGSAEADSSPRGGR